MTFGKLVKSEMKECWSVHKDVLKELKLLGACFIAFIPILLIYMAFTIATPLIVAARILWSVKDADYP